MRKPASAAFACALSLALAAPAFAGGHLGEARDIDTNVQYFLYSYVNQDGPVYTIGTEIKYIVTLTNIGNHDFKNLQSKGLFVWAADFSCMWDGVTYTYQSGAPLPGTPDSGWQPVAMEERGGTATFTAYYPIPATICPGSQANLILSARNHNTGSDSDAGSFVIPAALKFK